MFYSGFLCWLSLSSFSETDLRLPIRFLKVSCFLFCSFSCNEGYYTDDVNDSHTSFLWFRFESIFHAKVTCCVTCSRVSWVERFAIRMICWSLFLMKSRDDDPPLFLQRNEKLDSGDKNRVKTHEVKWEGWAERSNINLKGIHISSLTLLLF